MQNLMEQIIEMDRKARKITEAAQLEKVNSEKAVQKNREKIRRKYLEEARRRISLIEPQERAAAEKNLEELKRKSDAFAEKFEKLYAENGDAWVEKIVRRVTGE